MRENVNDCSQGIGANNNIPSVHPNNSPLKILEIRERGRIQGLPKFFGYPPLSREKVKLQTSYFVCTFIGSSQSEQKPIKNFGKSSCGHNQGHSKIFRAPIYRAHRPVIFAIAQLSCLMIAIEFSMNKVDYIMNYFLQEMK